MQKKAGVTPLHDVLRSFFQDARRADALEQMRVRAVWNRAVGPTIAANSSPAAIRGAVLVVNVSSSVWMQELHFLKDRILEKINRDLTALTLKDIRFTIGSLPDSDRAMQAEELPDLDETDRNRVSEESASIQDQDLRELFQRVMTCHLKNKKAQQR